MLLSITGLEFAYTQSPPALKTVVGALWQLTVAGGNLIVILVASSNLLEQFYEYLLFAALMLLALGLFLYIARGYKYRHAKGDTPVGGEGDVSRHTDDIERM